MNAIRSIATQSVNSIHAKTWQRALQIRSAFVWGAFTLILLYFMWIRYTPRPFTIGLVLVGFVMCCFRFFQALSILYERACLSGVNVEFMDQFQFIKEFFPKIDSEQIWFGYGFDWTPEHAQKLYELSKIEINTLLPNHLLISILLPHTPKDPKTIGLAAIHGLNREEKSITVAQKTLEGGTLIVGTTQAGKGVLLSTLVTQAIARNDTVIIIDPKNSQRLRKTVISACRLADRPAPFLFHPADTTKGVRLNPLAHYCRPSELASRITSVMGEDGPFTAFAWSAINTIVELMVYTHITPTIALIEEALTGQFDVLLLQALQKEWPESLSIYPSIVGDQRQKISTLIANRRALPTPIPPSLLAGISVFEHDPTHYQKITASLMPILAMLTSGSLRESLSPRPNSNDLRPTVTLEKVLRVHGVIYIALDALPDPVVASALGAILLSDLASLAGERYNNSLESSPISLFVDECSNVINRPLIELLNKGAESGLRTTCAMQTVSDLAARLGSNEEARMALGNFNNLVALRTKDQITQNFIVETFGRTYIANFDASIGSTSEGLSCANFSANYTRRVTSTREEIVPADILGKLPNCEYFACLAGGRLIKGRIPILSVTEP